MEQNKVDIPVFDYFRWVAPEDVKSSSGRRKTQSLFLETIQKAQHEKYPAVYTLCEKEQWDYRHNIWLPSAKQVYIQSNSEYEAAIKLVGSIEHWNMLLNNDWFVDGIDGEYQWTSLSQWKQEQDMRKISLAESVLISQAMQGDTNAAKFIIMGPKKVGRPDKLTPEIKEAVQKRVEKAVGNDHQRLFKVIDGKAE